MYDNYIMIAIGSVLIFASFMAKGIAYGMPSQRQKTQYPASRRLRGVLFCFGFTAMALGLARVLHK